MSSGCIGKIGYASRGEANQRLARLSGRRGECNALTSYHCKQCGRFHLGRNPKLRKREHRPWIDNLGKLRRYQQLIGEG